MLEIASKNQLRWAFLRAAAIFVPLIVMLGNMSGRAGKANMAWYGSLLKPGITPSGIYFPIAWNILYVLMGFAIAVVWYARGNKWRTLGFILFGIQIALNFAWTPVFFGAQKPGAALAIILALFVMLAATTYYFFKIRRSAGLLMLPCLLWVVFATYLNAQIWRLNRNAPVGVLQSDPATQQRQSPGVVPL